MLIPRLSSLFSPLPHKQTLWIRLIWLPDSLSLSLSLSSILPPSSLHLLSLPSFPPFQNLTSFLLSEQPRIVPALRCSSMPRMIPQMNYSSCSPISASLLVVLPRVSVCLSWGLFTLHSSGPVQNKSVVITLIAFKMRLTVVVSCLFTCTLYVWLLC